MSEAPEKQDTQEKQGLQINWVQATAGALTALTSAVLLSTVGVAGTLIGAAVGSVLATVGNAVYSYYLNATKERLAAARAAALGKVAAAHAHAGQVAAGTAVDPAAAEQEMEQVREELREAEAELQETDRKPKVDWREALTRLPWKRIAVVAGAIFAVVMLAILAFELITGRAVSTYTGGSDRETRNSITGLTGDRTERDRPERERDDAPADQPEDSDPDTTGTPAPTTEPTLEPTEGTPTAEPTEPAPTREPTPAPTAPAPVPTAPTPEAPAPTATP